MDRIVIIGAGGHARVVTEVIESMKNTNILGYLDDNKKSDSRLCYPILGKIEEARKFKKAKFIIAIGDNSVRKEIHNKFPDLEYFTAIHKSSIISPMSRIGIGTVVMPGVVINSEAIILDHTIINTNSTIEHDSIVGSYSHIAPGATICGTVRIGDNVFIGSNSTTIQNICIDNNCLVGAGSVVIKDIEENSKVAGNPAKQI